MAFPHPKSRKGKYRYEDKPSSGGVVWDLFKRKRLVGWIDFLIVVHKLIGYTRVAFAQYGSDRDG